MPMLTAGLPYGLLTGGIREYVRHRRSRVNSTQHSMVPIRSGLVAAIGGLLVPAVLDCNFAVSAQERSTSFHPAGIASTAFRSR